MLGEYSEEKAQDVIDKENRVDVYDDKITAYLTKLSSENLSYKDSLQVTSLLHCITDFERISDHSINVVESVQQMRKENLTFSRKGEEEMNLYGAAIRDILTRTTDAFVNNDQALAHTVEPLEEVIDELNKDEYTKVTKVSDFIETEPYGGVEQDDFLNGCIEVETLHSPDELLHLINAIERDAGRERLIHWGPRTLDIDILLYDDLICDEENLHIPHIEMCKREFVLEPLSNIAGYKRHPVNGRTIRELLDELERNEE